MTKKLGEQVVPAREDDVLERRDADGTIAIMHLNNDDCFFSVDGLAAEIWQQIDGKTTIQQIKQKIVKKFDPPLNLFEKDFSELFTQLEREKLISL